MREHKLESFKMNPLILKLDISGRPLRWVSKEAGALLYCRDQVVWEAGKSAVRLHGGMSRVTGERSFLDVNTIIATRGVDAKWSRASSATRRRTGLGRGRVRGEPRRATKTQLCDG